jgi:hypothetical protein
MKKTLLIASLLLWLLARRKKLRHLQLLLLLKLRPLLLRLLMQSRLDAAPAADAGPADAAAPAADAKPADAAAPAADAKPAEAVWQVIFGLFWKNRSQDRFFSSLCFVPAPRFAPSFLHLRRSFLSTLGIQTALFLDLAQMHQIAPQSLRSNPSICVLTMA